MEGDKAMTQKQLDLMKELNQVIDPIIRKYIENEGLEITDVVYCSMVEAETIALAAKRKMIKGQKDTAERR